MTNASFIADTVGRAKIADACEVGLTAVSNAVVRGRFPASWYFPVRYLCDEAGIDCPLASFGMKVPPVQRGGAIASNQEGKAQ